MFPDIDCQSCESHDILLAKAQLYHIPSNHSTDKKEHTYKSVDDCRLMSVLFS